MKIMNKFQKIFMNKLMATNAYYIQTLPMLISILDVWIFRANDIKFLTIFPFTVFCLVVAVRFFSKICYRNNIWFSGIPSVFLFLNAFSSFFELGDSLNFIAYLANILTLVFLRTFIKDISLAYKIKKNIPSNNYKSILFYSCGSNYLKESNFYIVCKNGYIFRSFNGTESLTHYGKTIAGVRWKSALNEIGVSHFIELSDDEVEVFEMLII